MAKGLNKVQLIGNATANAEAGTAGNGSSYAKFSIAVNETWKAKDGSKQERTEFVNCIAFSKLGEIVGEYVKKGDKIYVEGKLNTHKTEDGKYFTNVVCDNIILIGGNKKNGTPVAKPAEEDSPLPF